MGKSVIGRSDPLFSIDVNANASVIDELVRTSSFLVIGAAGTLGKAVTMEILKRNL